MTAPRVEVVRFPGTPVAPPATVMAISPDPPRDEAPARAKDGATPPRSPYEFREYLECLYCAEWGWM